LYRGDPRDHSTYHDTWRFAYNLEDLDLLAVYLELSKVQILSDFAITLDWLKRKLGFKDVGAS
jgi:hypothetical protein